MSSQTCPYCNLSLPLALQQRGIKEHPECVARANRIHREPVNQINGNGSGHPRQRPTSVGTTTAVKA
jgi:hypothetical protein